MSSFLSLGLMSGTSADGVDAACMRTDGRSDIDILGSLTIPYADELRQQLITAASSSVSLDRTLRLQRKITLLHAQAVETLCGQVGIELSDVDVIGFHGHTFRHEPAAGITHQVGSGALLAELTGRPVVFDFRQSDIAAGGQGAPLAPLYHAAILGDRARPALFLNLGGVANVTWVGRGHSEDSPEIIAGDTGPGCGLLDALSVKVTGAAYDQGGKLAASGTVDTEVVQAAIDATPFFQRPLPKSADRYEFTSVDVSSLWYGDAAATLCAITVEAIRRAVEELPEPPVAVWASGGGVKHPVLMRMLTQYFPEVTPISALGHDPDSLEAACFAWLAVRNRLRLPTSYPGTTGASQPMCGGVLAAPTDFQG